MDVVQKILKRTIRLRALACAFVFCTGLAFSDELIICSECGREGSEGEKVCKVCGAVLDGVEDDSGATEDVVLTSSVKSATEAAKEDVAEARRLLQSNPDIAVALLRNAQALLASDIGEDFNDAAAKALEKEFKTAASLFNDAFRPMERSAVLAKARSKCAPILARYGRIRFGNAFVPNEWITELKPQQLAAIRLALQVPCAQCAGSGAKQCKDCKGQGSTPCKASGCQKGWISKKQTNALNAKNALMVREKCPSCKGKAAIVCNTCHRRGFVPCNKCQGSGDAPICGNCQGLGIEPCPNCSRKNGVDDCIRCKGTKQALCKKCGGDGRIAK